MKMNLFNSTLLAGLLTFPTLNSLAEVRNFPLQFSKYELRFRNWGPVDQGCYGQSEEERQTLKNFAESLFNFWPEPIRRIRSNMDQGPVTIAIFHNHDMVGSGIRFNEAEMILGTCGVDRNLEALDATFVHEWAHFIFESEYRFNKKTGRKPSKMHRALDELFADYFAATFLNDPQALVVDTLGTSMGEEAWTRGFVDPTVKDSLIAHWALGGIRQELWQASIQWGDVKSRSQTGLALFLRVAFEIENQFLVQNPSATATEQREEALRLFRKNLL